jgi:Tfp pilus assembly protein PilW
MIHMHQNRAFTLIETVVYMAIAAVIFAMVTSLYYALESARLKETAIAEVEEQGDQALALITQDVRDAQAITAPATSTSATFLTILAYAATTSPTVFDAASSTLRIKEGAASPVALTNTQVIVSNLSFQNLSLSGTSGSVKIQFTISAASTTKQFDTTYSKTFYGSATLRRLQQ